MEKAIEIEAKNKAEARNQAVEKMTEKLEREVKKEELVVQLQEERKGFLGLISKDNLYQVGLKNFDEEKASQKIDSMAEKIDIDGEFKFKMTDEGVMIKVIPPQGEGDKVHYQEIKQALEKREIVEVDWQVIQEATKNPEEKWIKIAPRKPELDRDAEISVEISDDKMEAFLDYIPALGGEKITFSSLKESLEERGVVYGIDEEKIRTLVDQREKVKEMKIAEGDSPTPGEDAEIIYHFEEKEEAVGTEREDGSIDFYDLGLINNVQPGDVLVTIKEPQPGEPGMGVDGKEIPPEEPEDKQLPVGKNVETREERKLVASIEGQVVKERNKVNVLPVHKVNGNVDLNSGNIDFVGNVVIKGDVLEGFEVKAEGNVEVRGNVNGAFIESGGEVVVHKGFVGKNKGEIKARGNIKVKFVENSYLKSQKNITIKDAVMHSTVIAGEKIEVKKGKGLIVGGKCRAAEEIEANIIGSSFATDTKIEAGIDPECKEEIKELKEEIEKDKNNQLKTKKAIKLLQEMKKKKGKLPSEKENMYHQLEETNQRLEERLEKNQARLEELQERLNKLDMGKVLVNRKVFPGVKIAIGQAQYNVHNQMSRTAFIEEKGEVRQISHD